MPRFNDGVKRVEAKDWAGAVAIWTPLRECLPEKHRPVWHLYLGLAYKELKQLPEAWHHVTEYLRTSGKQDLETGRDLEEIEKTLVKQGWQKVSIACLPAGAALSFEPPAAEKKGDRVTFACPLTWWFKPGKQKLWLERESCEPKQAELDIQARGGKAGFDVALDVCYGRLSVEGNRRVTQVFLNGALEGKVPFTRKLKSGTYELMVGPPGEMPWKKTVEIRPGETVVEAPQIAIAVGMLVVEGPPGTVVFLQGKPVGKVPVEKELSEGSYPLEATGPRGEKWEGKADVKGGEPTRVLVKFPAPAKVVPPKTRKQKGRTAKAGGAALLASGLAMVLTGGVLNGVASHRNEELHDKYPPPCLCNKKPYEEAYEEDVKPLTSAAYALYAVGGAVTVAGATWLIVGGLKSRSQKEKSVSITPAVGPDSAGLTVGWEF